MVGLVSEARAVERSGFSVLLAMVAGTFGVQSGKTEV
jgi:hypothetical protein